MRFFMYCSSANTIGIDEYLGFFAIDEEGYCARYLEFNATGLALRYTEERAADKFGVLPEGSWDENSAELEKPEYGVVKAISAELFDAIWLNSRCANE